MKKSRSPFLRLLLFLIPLVALATTAYFGYQGYLWCQAQLEHNTVLVADDSDLMRPLSDAVHRYAIAHGGQLPQDIPLANLLAQYQLTASYLPHVAADPAIQIKWNTAIQNLSQCRDGRYIILWIDDPSRTHYASVMVSDGERCIPVIVHRFMLDYLTGQPAPLGKTP